MDKKIVTVIGANGTMGRNVAGIFASFGGCKVYLVCRTKEKAEAAIPKAVASVRADSIAKRLIPADYAMLGECVVKSDIIIEHIVEDMSAKKAVMEEVAANMKAEAIVGTGSSGLSITQLAECFSAEQRKRFFGIHMFNPPYSMTLCEIIATKYSDDGVKENLKAYLSDKLRRTVVEVKDSPAFLANRIGFQFINEALIYAERYKDNGGIDYIDAILGAYTGRAMAPITTADFVGLDVHKAIVDNVYSKTNDFMHKTFKCPDYINGLISDGKLGCKSGSGVYKLKKFESGARQMFVYDISTKAYREQMRYVFPFAEAMIADFEVGNYKEGFKALIYNHSAEAEICLKFLLEYIVYSLVTVNEVGYSVDSVDDVMATGFNWCPPLAVIDALSSVTDVKALVKERLNLQDIDVGELWKTVKPSKYDYRIYFKAKK